MMVMIMMMMLTMMMMMMMFRARGLPHARASLVIVFIGYIAIVPYWMFVMMLYI